MLRLHTRKGRTGSFILSVLAANAAAHAGGDGVIRSIVEEGDVIAGVGTVTGVNQIAIAGGGVWRALADTNAAASADEVLLGGVGFTPGTQLLREGSFTTVGGLPGALIGAFDVNSSGAMVISVTLNQGAAANEAIVFDDPTVAGTINVDVAVEGAPLPTELDAVVGPGKFWGQLRDVAINEAGVIAATVSIKSSAAITIGEIEAVATFTPNGSGGFTAALVAKTADVLGPPPGQTVAFALGFSFDDTLKIADDGDVMWHSEFPGATLDPNFGVILNTTVVLKEGDPAPGGEGELFANNGGFLGAALDTNGTDWAAFGRIDLDGNLVGEKFALFKNGLPIVEQSVTMAEGLGVLSGRPNVGCVSLTDDGRAVWNGAFQSGSIIANVLGDQPLVQTGDLTDDGQTVAFLFNGGDAFYVSGDGEWFIFRARLNDTTSAGTDGAYLIQLPTPCPLDLSGNELIDADDIFAFLNLWFAAGPGTPCTTPPTGCPGDWNSDGLITADDIFTFLNDWFAAGPGSACP